MNKTIGLQLIVYSLLLAGLSYFAHDLVPELAQATLITGLVGGGLCLLWGVGAALGMEGKAPPILTLIPISFVMFSQTILALGGGSPKVAPDRTVAALTILLFALSIAMLARIAGAGLVSQAQPPSPSDDGRSQTTNDKETGGPG